ncbi:MAG: prepilin-type N-terminal cleavage/methylation domain-containing protein [Planctomycetota bacterium]
MRRDKKRGFTLIELLVVISIIAMLIAILLPAIGSARQSARTAVCLSNCKQMALATVAYATEHDMQLPTVGFSHGGETFPEQGSWFFLLEDYVQDDAKLLYRCPSDTSAYWDTVAPTTGKLRRVSYATSFTLGFANGFEAFGNLDRIPSPSSTIFAVELTEGGQEPGNLDHSGFVTADHVHPETWTGSTPADADDVVGFQVQIDQHQGSANYTYLDGHAERLSRADTFENATGSVTNPVWTVNQYWPDVAR